MGYVLTVLSALLAFILAEGAAHKLLQRERLAVSTAELTGLSVSTGAILSLAAAGAEVAAAVMLLVPGSQRTGALVAAALWGLYSILLWTRRGSKIDCGCTINARPDDARKAIPRALSLSCLAALVAVSAEFASFRWEFILAGAAFFAFYIAGNEMLALSTLRRSIGR
ncbi:MauE/DoxX family redox-associated membrane protein [Aquisediminimonas profunda]|uniref:MauE/DoxX family redox-associated membrane protein n=1 Tax=Aquisediminimonas profunda TaxID=1550733 RepID=UPI0031B844D1